MREDRCPGLRRAALGLVRCGGEAAVRFGGRLWCEACAAFMRGASSQPDAEPPRPRLTVAAALRLAEEAEPDVPLAGFDWYGDEAREPIRRRRSEAREEWAEARREHRAGGGGGRPRVRPITTAVRFRAESLNGKLSPVEYVAEPGALRPRPFARGARASSTYASIAATCPDACAFKGSGCFAQAGFTRIAGEKMDRAAVGMAPLDVMRQEAAAIDASFRNFNLGPAGGAGRVPQDGARGGRDLRLHVGGDASCEEGARLLAGAASRWRARGGGAVWTFSHRWREIAREAWGPISVLASVERPEEIAEAAARGYAAAIVVPRFGGDGRRAYRLPMATGRVLPCPAETTAGVTCVSCRLCLDAGRLLRAGTAIAFAIHGRDADAARAAVASRQRRLPVLAA